MDEGREGGRIRKRTLSELSVLGTASSSSWYCVVLVVLGLGKVEQDEKEQKFIVLTSRTWSIHGCFLGSGDVSTGRMVLNVDSSAGGKDQTISLLSFP